MHGRITIIGLLIGSLFLGGCATQNTQPTKASVDSTLRDSARVTLVKMLGNSNPSIRANAIEGIQDTLGVDGRLYFFDALKDEAPVVRFAALMAIGKTQAYNGRTYIAPLLRDSDTSVRLAAVYADFRLGARPDTLLELERSISNPNASVRGNVCMILGILGESSATRILTPRLRDSSTEVSLQAAEALWRLNNDDGLNALLAYSLRGDPGVQIFSIDALAKPRNKRIIQHVRVGLSSEYFEVKLHSALALGMLGSDEGASIALSAIAKPEVYDRVDGAIALGEIGKPSFAAELAPLLKDSDDKVKTAAAIAILKLKGKSAGGDTTPMDVPDEDNSDDDNKDDSN